MTLLKNQKSHQHSWKTLQLKTAMERLLGPINTPMLEFLIQEVRWKHISSGQLLYRKGTPGDCMHFLISGRLKAVDYRPEGTVVLGEIVAGECVGEMSVLTGAVRTSSIYAIRDSSLIEISNDSFQCIMKEFPELLLNISRTVIQRLSQRNKAKKPFAKIKTIALVPVHRGLPMNAFAQRLKNSLQVHGNSLHLNSQIFDECLQAPGISQIPEDDFQNLKVSRWLDQEEQNRDFILLQTDDQLSEWTRRCVRQADKIILVGDFYGPAEERSLEQQLIRLDEEFSHASVDIVLVHPDGSREPVNTARHLENRNIHQHHHLRWDRDGDFDRIGRILSGNAIGLVLGGGGARGFAHVGAIKALREQNIPFDYVGGTSIGAVIGGIVCKDYCCEKIDQLAKAGFVKDRPLTDYAWPFVSIYKGYKMERILQKYYGKGHIEDQWINFYCVSANLSTAKEEIHSRGLLWKSIRASLSLPGVFPPVVHGNHLLVDGGLMNNLPVDIMQQKNRGKIVAIGLRVQQSYELNYDKIPRPFRLLRDLFLPKSKRLKVPRLTTIMSKSTLLSSSEKGNAVRQMADIFLNPPVGKFSLLDFKRYEDIKNIGYQHTRAIVGQEGYLDVLRSGTKAC